MPTPARHASEDPELAWARDVYQGEARQLTLRAALAGAVLGGVLCLSNLYVVLKTGWSLGVTLTSSLLAYLFFRLLKQLRVARTEFSALENNAVASVASAGAWMTGGGNMAALPALLLLTGARPGGWAMFFWFAAIAALGVFAAIPLKRQLINREQLPFPSSIATAETIRALHAGKETPTAARALLGTGLLAAAFTLLRDAAALLPERVGLPFALGGVRAAGWTLGVDLSPVLFGGGSLMQPRTAWSLLGSALLTYGLVAPWMVRQGVIAQVDYKAIVQFTVWPGAALLASAGVTSILLQWRTIGRALGDLARALRGARVEGDALARIEAPRWWFPAGFAVLSPVMVALMHQLFGIPWWAGALAIPLSLVVGVVAARVTGETDVTPTKAMGPATQLLYGGLLPGHLTANVMSANVTGGVGLHAADLLSDLKTGYLLGASPRRQIAAQLLGLLVGAAVVVPAFSLLVPTASVLGSEQFPAPAVMVWAGVSKALAAGLSGLAPQARVALALGAAAGAGLVLIERALPVAGRRWVPSASGVGLAMVMPAATAISMFLGAMAGAWLRRRGSAAVKRSLIPAASGLVAGESLTGIALALAHAVGR